MSNWELDFNIGDRVRVDVARTTRDARTHQIIVEHGVALGEIVTLDLDDEALGIRFDAGDIRQVASQRVRKLR